MRREPRQSLTKGFENLERRRRASAEMDALVAELDAMGVPGLTPIPMCTYTKDELDAMRAAPKEFQHA